MEAMQKSMEKMEAMQKSLEKLMETNVEMAEKIKVLEKERDSAATIVVKTENDKKQWAEVNIEMHDLLEKMVLIRKELLEDRVEESFLREKAVKLEEYPELMEVLGCIPGGNTEFFKRETEKQEEELQAATPFDGTGKEETVEMSFGRDGDYSSLSLRRFVERYKVVKELNMRAQLRGWDSSSFRANKLKLCLLGEAFDYVSFASSIGEGWADDDDQMVEKLKEKFTNIHAIELNILQFEKSEQEPREAIGDYMSRLRRSVKEAYDGDTQRELDRKVAWKFVSGLRDESVRRKLLEEGWMKSRQEAKPLDDILKLAEVTRKTNDAAKALGRGNSVGAVHEARYDQFVGAVGMGDGSSNRSKKFSSESGSSSTSRGSSGSGGYSSSDMPLDLLECYYCKQKHRGGWLYCSQRKRENPSWKPFRRGNSATGKPKPSKGPKTDFQ